MTDSTITDGTTTITFASIRSIDYSYRTEKERNRAFPKGRGNIVLDRGYKFKFFTIEFVFKNTTGPVKTSIEYLEDLESLWETKHATYGYQRKLAVLQPDGRVRNINGKMGNISVHAMHGDDFNKVEGKFGFKLDTESLQVP